MVDKKWLEDTKIVLFVSLTVVDDDDMDEEIIAADITSSVMELVQLHLNGLGHGWMEKDVHMKVAAYMAEPDE